VKTVIGLIIAIVACIVAVVVLVCHEPKPKHQPLYTASAVLYDKQGCAYLIQWDDTDVSTKAVTAMPTYATEYFATILRIPVDDQATCLAKPQPAAVTHS
jgi:hypothetical protein